MFLLVIVLVILAAYLLNHSLLFLLAALFVGTFIYDWLLLRFTFPKLILDWEPPHQLFARQTATFVLNLTSGNRLFPIRELHFEIHGIGLKSEPQKVERLPPKEPQQVSINLHPMKRGRLKLSEMSMRCAYPFGFWERYQTQPLNQELLVFPALLPQGPEELLGRQHRRGTIPRNAQDFQYLAKYRTGDDVRLIHWRKSTLLETPVLRKDLSQVNAAKPKVLVADPCHDFELGLSALATLAVTTHLTEDWSLWTAKGIQPLPTPFDLLIALAKLQPLEQDALTQIAADTGLEIIRVSEIAEAAKAESLQASESKQETVSAD